MCLISISSARFLPAYFNALAIMGANPLQMQTGVCVLSTDRQATQHAAHRVWLDPPHSAVVTRGTVRVRAARRIMFLQNVELFRPVGSADPFTLVQHCLRLLTQYTRPHVTRHGGVPSHLSHRHRLDGRCWIPIQQMNHTTTATAAP